MEFYFKGDRHDLSAIIDMDVCMRHHEPMQHIYHTLAAENGIGSHSYELDVMAMEPICFSEPRGLVADFICNGELDIEGFYKVWQQERISSVLQPIARKHLGIENLNEHPEVKAALFEAYEAK